jgi:hypothetical protein
MPEKEKKPDFVVTDRRLFSSEGELRQDVVEDQERRAERERENREVQQRRNEERAAERQSVAPETATSLQEPPPEAPSAEEQKDSAAAYEKSARENDERLDQELRQQGRSHSAKDFQVTFDKFIASLYMTALMQLGLAAPQGEKPTVDLIGARQTIDTVAMLQEKTNGNLTPAEENMLQNILYELRMAYLEVTNMITNPPPPAVGADRKR